MTEIKIYRARFLGAADSVYVTCLEKQELHERVRKATLEHVAFLTEFGLDNGESKSNDYIFCPEIRKIYNTIEDAKRELIIFKLAGLEEEK